MNGSLYLSPKNAFSPSFDPDALRQLLEEIRLIGNNWKENRYFCGDRFLQLITFMGCSPYLEFEPDQDAKDNFCHIVLHDFEKAELLTGKQSAPPRCPGCRFRIADWKQALPEWRNADENHQWSCPQCGQNSHPTALDWRRGGGAARQCLEICNIFPGEAVPVDMLMKKLSAFSGTDWQYFYLTG